MRNVAKNLIVKNFEINILGKGISNLSQQYSVKGRRLGSPSQSLSLVKIVNSVYPFCLFAFSTDIATCETLQKMGGGAEKGNGPFSGIPQSTSQPISTGYTQHLWALRLLRDTHYILLIRFAIHSDMVNVCIYFSFRGSRFMHCHMTKTLAPRNGS